MPFIQTPGLHIHYEQAGEDGEAIILTHGNFASWRWWQPLLEHLASGYRAYAPDLRGCGDTEKPPTGYTIEELTEDLTAFADALHIDRFHLVGHSLGGAIALQFALSRSPRLLSLTLVAPAPTKGLSAHMDHHSILTSLVVPGTTLSHWLPTLVLHRPIMSSLIDHLIPGRHGDAELQPLVDDALRISPLALTRFMDALDHWNIQAQLHRVEVPVLIVGGEQDPLVSPKALEQIADGLPQAQLVIWPDTGHAPQLEHPEQFLELLLAFLKRPATSAAEEVPKPQPQPPQPGSLHKLWDQLTGFLGHKG